MENPGQFSVEINILMRPTARRQGQPDAALHAGARRFG